MYAAIGHDLEASKMTPSQFGKPSLLSRKAWRWFWGDADASSDFLTQARSSLLNLIVNLEKLSKHYGENTPAKDDMALSWKHGATTACQANLPQNIAKRDQFWTQAYPMGILGMPHQTIVDFDGAGIFLQSTDCGFGNSFIGKDLNEEGPYSRSMKLMLCMAICGDAGGCCWLTFELKKGTSIYGTISFLQE
jgi:hypothetical protein